MKRLPFDVPVVHVDALWHGRRDADSAHRWLRDAITRSAQVAPTR